jgi:hypothetical protein
MKMLYSILDGISEFEIGVFMWFVVPAVFMGNILHSLAFIANP